MKLWFIRHAEAADRETFTGNDLERPLTVRGIRRSRESFKRLAERYRAPERIFSSEAVRARETAQILSEAYGLAGFEITRLLNPGSSPGDIRRLVDSLPDGLSSAAFIGHEPDFSCTVSDWTSRGTLNMNLKKGGLVVLDLNKNGTARLIMSVPPKILGD